DGAVGPLPEVANHRWPASQTAAHRRASVLDKTQPSTRATRPRAKSCSASSPSRARHREGSRSASGHASARASAARSSSGWSLRYRVPTAAALRGLRSSPGNGSSGAPPGRPHTQARPGPNAPSATSNAGRKPAPLEARRRDALREFLWYARLHVSKTFAPILASLLAVAGGCDRLRAASPYVGHWERGASSPITPAGAPGGVVDGPLSVFGGFDSASLTVSRRVDAYEPESGTWSRRRDLPIEVTHVVPAVDGRRVWFAGGFEGGPPGKAVANVIVYDAARDTWRGGPALPD